MKMKAWVKLGLLVVFAFVLAGCASNPLGMSDAEWEALSPSEKVEARVQQEKLNAAEMERRAEKRRQEAAKERELQDLRQNAPYGDVVQCTLTNAKAKFSGDWHPAQSVSVELHESEDRRQVRIAQADRPTRGETLHMGFDGMNVKVCKWYNRDCDVMAGSERSYERGATKRISVDGLVEGTLRCTLPRRKSPRARSWH